MSKVEKISTLKRIKNFFSKKAASPPIDVLAEDYLQLGDEISPEKFFDKYVREELTVVFEYGYKDNAENSIKFFLSPDNRVFMKTKNSGHGAYEVYKFLGKPSDEYVEKSILKLMTNGKRYSLRWEDVFFNDYRSKVPTWKIIYHYPEAIEKIKREDHMRR